MRLRRGIRRAQDGSFELRLPPDERDVLRSLPGQLREILGGQEPDPGAVRLFPPAHTDDPELEREYRGLVGDDLVRERLAAVDSMEATLDAERLSEEELLGWVSTLNDARLVLGTKLDVTEDLDIGSIAPDDPEAPRYALYAYLTWLEEEAVEALRGGLER